MALTKLGRYIEQSDLRNTDNKYGEDAVVGISTQKEMISTKADLMGVSLTSYKLLLPNHFAYVPDTSRRGDKVSLCFNNTDNTYLVSSISIVFRVNNLEKLSSDYLYIYFNRPEFDRYARFNSWGSARETFTWEDMCDIDIELPSLPVQKKYVDVYKAMLANQKSYERGLEDLKLTCDAYIETLFKTTNRFPLGNYIERRMEKNTNFSVKKLLGIGMNGFIEPKQEKDETNGHICYLIRKKDLVFAPPQVHKGSIALYEKDEIAKCSDAYVVFYTTSNLLLIDYVYAILKTPLFQKYAYYYRDGVREQFDFEQLQEFSIPIPDVSVQKSIVSIYKCYIDFRVICEKIKSKLKDICPILIKGSLEDGKQEEAHG